MKKAILGSALLVVLFAAFSFEVNAKKKTPQKILKNRDISKREEPVFEQYQSVDQRLLEAQEHLDEILLLSIEFSQAAEFMKDLAQGLVDLKKEDLDTFEKYFGDRFKSRLVLAGSDPSSWGPSFWNLPERQKKVYRLKSKLFQATRIVEDIAVGLALLRKDNPQAFDKYFGDKAGVTQQGGAVDTVKNLIVR